MEIFVALFVFIKSVSFFSGSPYLWGFDSWSYFPLWLFILVFVLCLSLVLVNRGTLIETGIKKTIAIGERIPFFIWLIPIVPLLYIIRQATYILGDGFLRVRDLEAGLKISAAEPLDTFLHNIVYDILSPLGFNGAEVYSLISILCGMIFFLISLVYIRKIWQDGLYVLFASLILFSCGSVQLFFGYVESYSVSAMFIAFFLLSSLLALTRDQLSIGPAVFLSLASVFHPVSFVFFPASIYLYARLFKSSGQVQSVRILKILLSYLSGLFLLIIVSILAQVSVFTLLEGLFRDSHLLPLLSNDQTYGILSIPHFIDIINEIGLLVPAFFLMPVFIIKSRGKGADNRLAFLWVAVSGAFLFLLVFKSELGFARDWDLFSIVAFPMALLLASYLIRIFPDKLVKWAVPVVIISLFQTVPWLLINNNQDLSISRAEVMLSTPYWSNTSRALLAEELSDHYFSLGNSDKAFYFTEIAYNNVRNPRYKYFLAGLNNSRGEHDKAIDQYKELLEAQYKPAKVASFIGDIYYKTDRPDSASSYFYYSLSLDSSNSASLYMLGLIKLKTGYIEESVGYFVKLLEYEPSNTDALNNLGEAYFNMGKSHDAVKVYETLLELNPENPSVYYNLSLCYADIGDYNKSIAYIDRARAAGFDQGVLDELERNVETARRQEIINTR